MKQINHLIIPIFVLGFFWSCSQKPQSDLDTPEYHFRAGMRAIDNENYSAAIRSFERSVNLDKKFALGYAGLALTNAHLGNNKEAKKNIEKAENIGGKNPDVLALCAGGWITMRGTERKWFKRAESLLKKALKRDENHETALYYFGEAQLYNYEFSEAEDYFRRVVDMKGRYAGKADTRWQLLQRIVRAMPGTAAGKKVALHEKITRADLAVLFVEELRIDELFSKLPQSSPGFQTPTQAKALESTPTPRDAIDHWAGVWIKDVLQYGILDISPDGKFYPDETITRAEYALAVQRALVAATRDESLETRYFGESPSRFGDVPSSHPAYNAMALCTERGIMQADVMTGKFYPLGSVSGPDALLIIRTLQTNLRMTF